MNRGKINIALLALCFCPGALVAEAAFVVTNSHAGGAGSFVQAILDANATPGLDIISFNIPSGSGLTITPTNRLPAITDSVTLDGTTQPGFAGRPLIEINGQFSGGLFIQAGFSTVRGLVINRVGGACLTLATNGNNWIAGNILGLDASGHGFPSQFSSLFFSGISLYQSSSNLLGGTNLADRNVIAAGNGAALMIGGDMSCGNRVWGNYLGTDITGMARPTNAASSLSDGVVLDGCQDNEIGGLAPGTGNVISGNRLSGIRVSGGAISNLILGNIIGLDKTGTSPVLPRSDAGIRIEHGSFNTIGGTPPAARNIISGNVVGASVIGSGGPVRSNRVLGNFIGTDITGLLPRGNDWGLQFGGRDNSHAGGVLPGEGNLIAFNQVGIFVVGSQSSGSTNISIRGNSIHSNSGLGDSRGLGIDLALNFGFSWLGVTANDAGDTDAGPNSLQNFPVLHGAVASATATIIRGSLNSREHAVFHIDVYANAACDPSGYGEGEAYIGSLTTTTDVHGYALFETAFPTNLAGSYITATATDASGNTSEFSLCRRALDATVPPPLLTVSNTNDSGSGSLRQAILDANAALGARPGSISFDIPGVGEQVISPRTPLPTVMVPMHIDGYTQPGAAPNTRSNGWDGTLLIHLDGGALTNAAPGLLFTAHSNSVRGLRVTGFSIGLGLEGGRGSVVDGNIIGLRSDQTVKGNTLCGVLVTNAQDNGIGGPLPAQRNIISGNADGIQVWGALASGNRIAGNYIGTDTGGGAIRGNGAGVLFTDCRTNVLGGNQPGEGNLISGNHRGLYLLRTVSDRIQGNCIGLDASGRLPMGNTNLGIMVFNGTNIVLGGPMSGDRNVISGTTNRFGSNEREDGVRLAGGLNNVVEGNFIGTDRTGRLRLGNAGSGLVISRDGAPLFASVPVGHRIGGPDEGQGNLIAFNRSRGVQIVEGTNHAVRGNLIHSSLRLNLALGNGFTIRTNDPGDLDTGANHGQNHPVLTGATNSDTHTVIAGTLNSRSNAAFVLDFYSGIPCEGSRLIGPPRYLGWAPVHTDGDGNAAFQVEFPIEPLGRYIVATATDAEGNTSEFSRCIAAVSTNPALTFTVVNTNDSGDGSLRQAIIDANIAATAGPDRIAFNLLAAGVQTIAPLSPLPSVLDAVVIDGFTQPGARPNTLSQGNDAVVLIRIDGTNAGVGLDGFRFEAPGNTVRGLAVVGFGSDGFDVLSANNVIEGNFIGIDVDGSPWGNGSEGITLWSAGNRIGGDTPGARNVISGNGYWSRRFGIDVRGAGQNRILGNFIGTDLTGRPGVPNSRGGVQLSSAATQTEVGGTNPGEGNVIAGNLGPGVWISAGSNISVRGNSLFGNAGLGIDLGPQGVLSNDPGDLDVGVNLSQNFPVLTNVLIEPGATAIAGTLSSRPDMPYSLDFYRSSAVHPSGFGEGEIFVGALQVTTDGVGVANFLHVIPGSFPDAIFTATATDPHGNTSEFSQGIRAGWPVNVPELQAATLGTNVVLSWPSTDFGYALDASPSLSPPVPWTEVAVSPVIVNGRHVITISPSRPTEFFRLRRR